MRRKYVFMNRLMRPAPMRHDTHAQARDKFRWQPRNNLTVEYYRPALVEGPMTIRG